MTARRIVVETPCGCDGGVDGWRTHMPCEGSGWITRQLEPGRYVLIERDENGEWPREWPFNSWSDILDALAQEPT